MENNSNKQCIKDFVIPERIQLETVYGCNARCTMCPVHLPSARKKGIMSFDLFKYIVDEMVPYKQHITKFDLWGLGEPLLDKNLVKKIQYAKDMGFQNLAIATNAELLKSNIMNQLFQAQLDTILFSIDGISKETHESIRVNTDFYRVVDNANNAIIIRNKHNYKTRFVFRFIRQEINNDEWIGFKEYWEKRISREHGDIIIGYDRHTWGGELNGFEPLNSKQKMPDETPCHHLFDRLIILWDGTVPMCCSDLHHAKYSFGNINEIAPIEAFNSKIINKLRNIHNSGKRKSIKLCKECSILDSEIVQEIN